LGWVDRIDVAILEMAPLSCSFAWDGRIDRVVLEMASLWCMLLLLQYELGRSRVCYFVY
jgi:hypothetical protein